MGVGSILSMAAAGSMSAAQLPDWISVTLSATALWVGILGIGAAYLLARAAEIQLKLDKSLGLINERQTLVTSGLIAIADLAVADLPQITFTQQIPGEVVDDVGFIDAIFDDQGGDRLWEEVRERKNVSRLAYARGVYRLSKSANSKRALLDPGNAGDGVVALLILAGDRAERSRDRDSVAFRRDIVVRKVQALRQANALTDALSACEELDELQRSFSDDLCGILAQWCRAVVYLQKGLTEGARDERLQAFVEARTRLEGPFSSLFGFGSDGKALLEYKFKRVNIELGSIAYYYAKALMLERLAQQSWSLGEFDAEQTAKLVRALDVSLLFYENARRRTPESRDPLVSCIYNLCVPLLVAMCNAVSAQRVGLHAFEGEYREDLGPKSLHELAAECVKISRDTLLAAQARTRPEDSVIYSERNERLDSLSQFSKDLDAVEAALAEPTKLGPWLLGVRS